MPESDLDAYASQILLRVTQDLLTPRQFTRCLTESGLSERATRADFVQNPGPIPQEHVRRFYEAIHGRCGEAVYRLFLHNFGTTSGQAGRADPGLIHLRTQYGATPAPQNFGLALGTIIASMQQHGVPVQAPVADPVTAETWHITFDPCNFCAGLTANAPICAFFPSLLREMLAWVANTRVVTKEIACRACGQDACVVLVARAV